MEHHSWQEGDSKHLLLVSRYCHFYTPFMSEMFLFPIFESVKVDSVVMLTNVIQLLHKGNSNARDVDNNALNSFIKFKNRM